MPRSLNEPSWYAYMAEKERLTAEREVAGLIPEICPEMHALAKMAEMAINRQNRQTINKNSNEMAKGPFAKWRFWRKWRIWRKWQKWQLIAKLYNKQKFK